MYWPETCMLLDLPRWKKSSKIQIFYHENSIDYTPSLHNRDENHAQRLWRSSLVVYRAAFVHRDGWIHNFKAVKKHSSIKLLPRTTYGSLIFCVPFFLEELSLSNWKQCSSLKWNHLLILKEDELYLKVIWHVTLSQNEGKQLQVEN